MNRRLGFGRVPSVQVGGDVKSKEGGDLERDGGQPARHVGEHDEKEPDGDFEFIRRQRRCVTRPTDAREQRQVHANHHQNATSKTQIKLTSFDCSF